MYNHEAMALYHENQRLAESIAAWENLMSPVPSVYETSDNHVIEGFDFDDTIYLPPRTSKKPVHIRCCTSKYSHGIIEIAGLTDTLFVEISSNVRIMVSAVLKNIVVVGCSNIELVIGGNPPKVVLLASKNCTLVACKDTWTAPWQSIGCTDISVHASHYSGLDSLEPNSILQANMVEKVLLPDMLVASVHRGTMTTQCHFSQLPALQEYRPPDAPASNSRAAPVPNGASAPFMPHHEPQRAVAPPVARAPPPELGNSQRGLDLLSSQRGQLCGVGLLLRRTEDGLKVAEMAKGGPAERDGRIKVGDYIMAVDGISTIGKKLRDVGRELSGLEGSELTITLKRFTVFGTSHLDVVLIRSPVATSLEDKDPNLYSSHNPLYSSINPIAPSRPVEQPSSAPLPPQYRSDPLYRSDPPLTRQSFNEPPPLRALDGRQSFNDPPQRARGLDFNGAGGHGYPAIRNTSLTVPKTSPPPQVQQPRFSTVSVPKARHSLPFDDEDLQFKSRYGMMSDTQHTLVGVGMGVKPNVDGSYRVSALVSGSVADQSGQIGIGDVLHSVDGIPLCGKPYDDVKELVRGPPGSRVVLVFLRPEARPENLRQTVDEFDWWRSVVLVRTAADTDGSGSITHSPPPPPAVPAEVSMQREKAAILASLGLVPDRSTMPRHADTLAPATRDANRETVALALWLDEDFEQLSKDHTSQTIYKLRMEGDIATSLKTELSRIRVMDLLPGSIVADIHVLPQQLQFSGDSRSSQRLAAEVSLMAVDPNSPLRIAATTRKAIRAEVRGPVSEVRPLREVIGHKQPAPPAQPSSHGSPPKSEWPTANPAMPPVPPPRSSLYNSAPQAPHGVAPPSYLSPPKYSSQADAYPATVQATRSTPPMEMPPHSSPPKPTGKKAGVGVELQKDGNGHTVVLAVMPGGTAWASGQLSPGDNIVAVDYIETVGKDMHEVVGLIVGEPGTSVVLSVAKTHPSFNVGNQTPVIHLPLLRRVEDVDYIPQDEEAEKLAREKAKLMKKAEMVNKKLEEIEDKEHLKEQQEMVAYIRRSRESLGSHPSSPQLSSQSAPAQPPPVQLSPPTRSAAPPTMPMKSSAPAQQQSSPAPAPTSTSSSPQKTEKLASIYTGPPRTVVLERAFAPTIAPADRVGNCGVGISFQAIRLTGQMMVTALVPGGSADSSGMVVAGDVIHLVNNASVTSKRIPDVVAMIKGPPGTPVVLELQTTCFTNKDLAGTVGGTLYASNAGGGSGTASRGLRNSFSEGVAPSQHAKPSDESPYPNYSLYGSAKHAGEHVQPKPPRASPPASHAPPAQAPARPNGAPPSRGVTPPPQSEASNRWPGEAGAPSWDQVLKQGSSSHSHTRPAPPPAPEPARAAPPPAPEPAPAKKADGRTREVVLVREPVYGQPGKVDPAAVGVGVGFQLRTDGTFVISGLVPGSTAEQSGKLELLDRILAVDGVPVEGKSVEKVVQLIRGPQGSTVTLTLEHTDRQLSPAVVPRRQADAPAPSVVPPGLAAVGLTVTTLPPYIVEAKSALMDEHRNLEGSRDYGNAVVRVGDEVVQVNQLATSTMPPGVLQGMLYGPPGTAVDLLCRSRQSGSEETYFVRCLCHQSHAPHKQAAAPPPAQQTHAPAQQTHAPAPAQPQSRPDASAAALFAPPSRLLHIAVKDAVGLMEEHAGAPVTYTCRLELRHPHGGVPGAQPAICTAVNSGGAPSFAGKVETFRVPVDMLAQTQLEITLWDPRSSGFFGEVLLNVEQIGAQGKYFEHTFGLQPSKRYTGEHRPVGNMTLGLCLDPKA